MGVRGLKTYLEKPLPVGKGKVWEWFELRDTNVVIDGSGLCYYIYTSNEINFTCGGQYNTVKEKLKEFFSKLKSNNVTPYVVFDGIMTKDDKKLETRMEREKKRINTVKKLCTSEELGPNEILLPRFVRSILVDVLEEMEVKYAVADFEADCEIASLANELDAPVMADDSDFCIFNIKHGYIPFQQYNFSGTNTKVKKFSHNGFCNHLGINPSMTPLLASLIGNDYISREMLRPFADHIERLVSSSYLNRGSKFSTVAQFLSTYNSVSEVIRDVTGLHPDDHEPSFETVLRLSIEEYESKQSNLIGYFDRGNLSCTMHTYNDHLLPEWVIELYRKSLIAREGLSSLCNGKVVLRVQCQDVSLQSAEICAQYLRWYYYALLLNKVTEIKDNAEEIIVKEFDRRGMELQEREVNLSRYVSNMTIQIHDIPKMSDQEKTSHLLSILLPPELQLIRDLPIEHRLVASALRYWVTHANVKPAHLAALLVHYVGEKESSNTSHTFQFNIEVVHGFSEWQTVLYWVKRLNALFSFPFEQLSVTRLYNGGRVYRVYKMLEENGIRFAKSIVTDVGLYRRLYAGIIQDLSIYSYLNPEGIPIHWRNNRYWTYFALNPNE